MQEFSHRVKLSDQLLFKTSFLKSWLTYKGKKIDLKFKKKTPFHAP